MLIFLLPSNSSEVSAFAMFLIPFYLHLLIPSSDMPFLSIMPLLCQANSLSNVLSRKAFQLLKAVSHSLSCSPAPFCSCLCFSAQHCKALLKELSVPPPCEILKSNVCSVFLFKYPALKTNMLAH